jgi:hypothetical protein
MNPLKGLTTQFVKTFSNKNNFFEVKPDTKLLDWHFITQAGLHF